MSPFGDTLYGRPMASRDYLPGANAVRDPGDLGAAVRAARRARGWTQAELAARARVGRQWLVSLERGHERAELGLVLAVLRELGLELGATAGAAGIDDARRTWMTAADTARAIRDELARKDEDFALRILARCVADFRALIAPPDLDAFLARPPSTGDIRWDTLLATTVSRECRLRQIPAPDWTEVPALPSWWFPIPDALLVARTMQRTPIELSIHGIWLD